MRSRQELVDTIREVVQEIDQRLVEGKFVKEVETFMLEEAKTNLGYAEKHLQAFNQVEKYKP
jgi:hypothetical protein